MDISRYGKFSFAIDSQALSRGLRPSKRTPRNSGYLVECDGAVGRDGVLQVLTALSRVNTTALTVVFPFPQIFILTNVILVCTATKIYEFDGVATLTEKIAITTGSLWSLVDFYNYIYMSNGVVSVIRNAFSLTYSMSTLPVAKAMCNFNGQVVIGV